MTGSLTAAIWVRCVDFASAQINHAHLYASKVTVVAQITSIQVQATNTVYMMEDGTGQMEARHWIDADSAQDSERWGTIA